MAAITDNDLWEQSENTVFEWLCTQTGCTNGDNAFIGRVPESLVNAWYFALGQDNSDEPLDFEWNVDTPGADGQWMMPAKVWGRYIKRAEAQQLGTILKTKLPIQSVLEGIYRVRTRGTPRLIDSTWEDGQGHLVAVWEFEYELEVLFQQT